MVQQIIPFTQATYLGIEPAYVNDMAMRKALPEAKKIVNNFFLNLCQRAIGSFFCNSCTGALELAALSIDVKAGDEIIVPDYTFVTSASAFALRGAKIVFCDVNPVDLCLKTEEVLKSITKSTKAIVWVDYAGCSNRAHEVRKICDEFGIIMIQDSAQSVGFSVCESKSENIVGDFVAFSFHSTKNITSGGEGGLLLVCNENYISVTEILYDKGTNRREFLRGNIDKYTWRKLGSSFEGADVLAAWLIPQLENISMLTEARRKIWKAYHETSIYLIEQGWILPKDYNIANAHIFWLIPPNRKERDYFIESFKNKNIQVVGHYQSLFSSPAGFKVGRTNFELSTSKIASELLIRLPLWHDMDESSVDLILSAIKSKK